MTDDLDLDDSQSEPSTSTSGPFVIIEAATRWEDLNQPLCRVFTPRGHFILTTSLNASAFLRRSSYRFAA